MVTGLKWHFWFDLSCCTISASAEHAGSTVKEPQHKDSPDRPASIVKISSPGIVSIVKFQIAVLPNATINTRIALLTKVDARWRAKGMLNPAHIYLDGQSACVAT